MFSLHLRVFAQMMHFTRAAKKNRANCENDPCLAKIKTHSALAQ